MRILSQARHAGILRKGRGQTGGDRRIEPPNIQGVAVERTVQPEYGIPRPYYKARAEEHRSHSKAHGRLIPAAEVISGNYPPIGTGGCSYYGHCCHTFCITFLIGTVYRTFCWEHNHFFHYHDYILSESPSSGSDFRRLYAMRERTLVFTYPSFIYRQFAISSPRNRHRHWLAFVRTKVRRTNDSPSTAPLPE